MKKNFIIIILLSLFILLTGCKKNQLIFKTFYLEEAFSIVPTIHILDNEKKLEDENLYMELTKITNNLDEKFNVFSQNSLISKVNKNAGICETYVDEEFLYVLSEAINISNDTIDDGKSLYDVSIYSIWKEWNFKDNYFVFNNYSTIPNNNIIKQKLPLVNYNNIIIDYDKSTVYLQNKGMMIDLGSIVKGYAADKIYNYLKNKSFNNCLIDIGGNIITMGNNIGTNKNWKVGILMPYSYNTEIGYVETNKTKETLVTSGIYQRYIVTLDDDKNEVIYHHILNPNTGYPENNELASVTIITTNSIKADAYSTAVFLLGLKKGLDYVNNKKNIDAIFITKNKEIYLSNDIISRFVVNEEIYDNGYKIIY